MRRVCFYHAGCPDGFGAAWAVWRAWGEAAEYLPRGHDDPLDAASLSGSTVAFVDVALDNRLLRPLGESARHVILLDHHVSARRRFEADPSLARELAARDHHVRFDLDASGAVLAWRHFHPGEPVPDLLRYVEDMDLWHWALPDSEPVNAAIVARPRSFDVWEKLASEPVASLADEGRPLAHANRVQVGRAVRGAHPVRLGGSVVEAVNASHLRSAIGHELSRRAAYGTPCGVVYRLVGDRVDASIYSVGDLDVSEIAAGFGGGGHRNAAGFSLTIDEWVRDFLEG